MKCKHVQQYLLDYSEQVLDLDKRQLVEEHLHHCPECTKELQDIEQTLQMLQSLPVQEPPETFWPVFTSDVMRQIRKMEPVSPKYFFFFPNVRVAMATLALLVIIGGGLFWYYVGPFQPPWGGAEMITQHSGSAEEQDFVQQFPDSETDVPTLDRIASEELIYDMLDSEFGLLEGGNLDALDVEYSNDWLYFLIGNLSAEEKDQLLLELYKLK
jgi:hypothetical protein